jgi:hypothetical protein
MSEVICVLCGRTANDPAARVHEAELSSDFKQSRTTTVHRKCSAKVPQDQRPYSRHRDPEVQKRLKAIPWLPIEEMRKRLKRDLRAALPKAKKSR